MSTTTATADTVRVLDALPRFTYSDQIALAACTRLLADGHDERAVRVLYVDGAGGAVPSTPSIIAARAIVDRA